MTRDFSRAQFKAACARQGFRPVLLWLEDTSGETPGISYGMISDLKGKVRRRESLSHAIRSRRAHARQNEREVTQ
jgi:hypothetical protein